MTVHDPQQNWLILITGIFNGLGEARSPGDFIPVCFAGWTPQRGDDGGVALLSQLLAGALLLRNRREREDEYTQEGGMED